MHDKFPTVAPVIRTPHFQKLRLSDMEALMVACETHGIRASAEVNVMEETEGMYEGQFYLMVFGEEAPANGDDDEFNLGV